MRRCLVAVSLLVIPFSCFAGGHKNKVDHPFHRAVLWYCIENPAFTGGVKNAHAFYELKGVADKKLQDRLNDSLKKFFYPSAFLQATDSITPGQTVYYCTNCANHQPAFHFRSKEKVKRFSQRDIALSGDGLVCVCEFDWTIAYGHYLNINGNFWMDLQTGATMKPACSLLISPQKKDSLDKFLDSTLRASLLRFYHKSPDYSISFVGESITVYPANFVDYSDHADFVLQIQLCFTSKNGGMPAIFSYCGLLLSDLDPFIDPSSKKNLDRVFP